MIRRRHGGGLLDSRLALSCRGAGASHLLVQRLGLHIVHRRGPRRGAQLAPALAVVLHGLARRVDDGARTLEIAARAADEALQRRVVLAAEAVPEHAYVLVLEGLGGVEHVLDDDERVDFWGRRQQLVDVFHRRHGRRVAICLGLTLGCSIPAAGRRVWESLLDHRLDSVDLANRRTDDVVEGLVRELCADRAHELGGGARGRDGTEVLEIADAGRGQQLLDRLVVRSVVQTNDGCLGQRSLADRQGLDGVGCGDGDDADVALLPQLWGAESDQRLVDVLVGLVAYGGGDVRLVDDDEDVGEVLRAGQSTEAFGDLHQALVVLDAVADSHGHTLARLQLPRVIVHAREHEDAVGEDTERCGIREDEADERSNHTSLARLHLCGEVHPAALDGGAEEVVEDLIGGELLGLVEHRYIPFNLNALPAELGLPEGGLVLGGDVHLGVGDLAAEVAGCAGRAGSAGGVRHLAGWLFITIVGC